MSQEKPSAIERCIDSAELDDAEFAQTWAKMARKELADYERLRVGIEDLDRQTYPCEHGMRDMVHIEVGDWDEIKKLVAAIREGR